MSRRVDQPTFAKTVGFWSTVLGSIWCLGGAVALSAWLFSALRWGFSIIPFGAYSLPGAGLELLGGVLTVIVGRQVLRGRTRAATALNVLFWPSVPTFGITAALALGLLPTTLPRVGSTLGVTLVVGNALLCVGLLALCLRARRRRME